MRYIPRDLTKTSGFVEAEALTDKKRQTTQLLDVLLAAHYPANSHTYSCILAAACSISCLVRVLPEDTENKGHNPIGSPLVSSTTHRTPCNTYTFK